MKKKQALQEIAESAAFWEQVFNEEALRSHDENFVYVNPWIPVEFARRIKELAEVALRE